MSPISVSILLSKKWFAPGMTRWSITMPFCVLSFSTRVLTSFCGATASLSPWMIMPEDGQGARNEEVVQVRLRRDRDEALDLGAAHQQLHADPGAEREARNPAGARFGLIA